MSNRFHPAAVGGAQASMMRQTRSKRSGTDFKIGESTRNGSPFASWRAASTASRARKIWHCIAASSASCKRRRCSVAAFASSPANSCAPRTAGDGSANPPVLSLVASLSNFLPCSEAGRGQMVFVPPSMTGKPNSEMTSQLKASQRRSSSNALSVNESSFPGEHSPSCVEGLAFRDPIVLKRQQAPHSLRIKLEGLVGGTKNWHEA
mmetsp:Transcript_97713/g.276412  ORF Transcript_97713/g.276412 Transcript_97713/m.276412 type:complete len:206 (+) Transcript_97713:689-1306(+)